MSAPTDTDISHWLDEAASGFVADTDLRERIDTRVRRRTRRARTAFAGATAMLVLAVIGVVSLTRGPQVVITPGSPPAADASGAGPAIDWSTGDVAFTAHDLEIDVSGARFVGADASGRSQSDPGTASYTTLERTWHEHGVEMRMNIYFKADGTNWWSDEIRTYNGRGDRPDWVTYTGDFFRTPLGQAFTGDLLLEDGDSRFVVHGLKLQAFIPPPCTPGAATVTIDNNYPDVTMTGPRFGDGVGTGVGSGYGVNVNLLGADCAPLADATGYRFTYTPLTDGIVTVTAEDGAALGIPVASHAELTGVARGRTDVRIEVRRAGDDTVLATATMHVTVV